MKIKNILIILSLIVFVSFSINLVSESPDGIVYIVNSSATEKDTGKET